MRIAGTGPFEGTPSQARGKALANVKSRGAPRWLGPGSDSFRGQGPWSCPRSSRRQFGYVVLEAFAGARPSWSIKAGGALNETGVLSGGGLGYQTDAELLLISRRIVHDDDLRDELSDRGYAMRTTEWSEAAHIDRYFELIQGIQSGSPGSDSSFQPGPSPR